METGANDQSSTTPSDTAGRPLQKRIVELDGVRGLAIVMVVFHHYVTNQTPAFDQDPSNWFSYFYIPSTAFWSGVDLFFVLSGFLIGGIILDNYRNPHFLRTFWIRRICRILPVYFFVLSLCYLLRTVLDTERYHWLFANLMPTWSYLSFTQNIQMAIQGGYGGSFLDITWSLAIEEQFYLFAPLAILAIGRRRMILSLLPLAALAVLLRKVDPGLRSAVLTPYRMDSLLCGVFIASLFRYEQIRAVLRASRASLLAVFLCLLAITCVLIVTMGFHGFEYLWFTVLYSLFILVVLLYPGAPITALLRFKPLCFAGTISYGLYMYHNFVNGLLHGYFLDGARPSNGTTQGALATGAALVLSVSLATASYYFYERFFHKLGRKYRYDDATSSSRLQLP